MRQEEMLRQIHEEKEKLLKQEEMIRSRQQDRLKQVRRKLGNICIFELMKISFILGEI